MTQLRPASLGDLDLLLRWRNDPLARSQSASPHAVTREEHERWLRASLADPDQELLVAEEDGVPVGTVCAQRASGIRELSWIVDPVSRGRGVGKRMVALFAQDVRGAIRAEVRAGDYASVRIAEHAGMKLEREADG